MGRGLGKATGGAGEGRSRRELEREGRGNETRTGPGGCKAPESQSKLALQVLALLELLDFRLHWCRGITGAGPRFYRTIGESDNV